ncbi:MAG: 30S ribosomal protein S3 [Candidatus Daviesbacteria bacterium GW2011_GWB1_39_5]|uniref:Small ribosomal subunit protein uS3 n=2 Tax=root TaxID=1 RepID=A0A0G0TW12_9BACT|nr:30S ribosomal protein S3 [uncultured organism]KKQ85396.1 MAG: 30S ribosomal protein S3 [Candidatus Daviesbacteria bacterium GW2011_GWF2_38_7]KKR17062.1 MAG: 30S ribosomal protein S3 [Candidatus Daviesbacteria bacterium GW2011_GWA2_39_33]KKR24268.1 MAG: 30S ribosomal protein S3 [Candidatus Daviesbacteria bacterium GW2011_GWB1_39_5]KKR42127.1 MAG: 30S ribosomal protein S3 [Candidatus Daviesbacteria bacterium GW2011_GWC2_40_12]OGE20891.1 MAG: 30S ribosomal protein S3 [Candidatus Daviesbacteria
MGKKIHPVGFRMGIGATWKSRWFARGAKYQQYVSEDIKIRELLMKKLKTAGVANVEIERAVNKLKVIIFVSRPGVLIGRGGTGLTEIKKFLMGELKIKNENGLEIAPMELRFSDLSAYLVALSVAEQLARRLPAQRVMNQAIERTMRAGAKGVRIVLSGRIGGAEIARREWKAAGTMPLHTLRSDIDFAIYPALTKSGYVGVKVWINKGEVEI